MDLTLGDVAEALDVDLIHGHSIPVKKVSTDSRTLRNGMLFFALRGEHFDGHDFVDEVLDKGACGAVVDKEWVSARHQGKGEMLLPVEDPLRALQDVASHYRKKFRFPVIAVTGTNGKTTTKEMISAVLKDRYRVMKSPGNLNNHIGLALSVCDWDEDGEIAVVEMGTNHFGEIRRLCEIARPTHGVITNIGKGHLEFFGDLRGVAQAKAELLEFLEGGVAILNGDDPYLLPLKNIAGRTMTYGLSEGCDFRGSDLGIDTFGFPGVLVNGMTVKIRISGRHNLYNGLAAMAVGRIFEVSWDKICEALESYRPLEKRMEVLRLSGITILNDAYNANPTSVREALVTLKSIKVGRRRIAVLGDMLELGESSRVEHRNVGEWIVELDMDGFFGYGPGMEVATARAKKLGLEKIGHFESKGDLVEALHHSLEEDDVVLVKGSRGMRMEEIVEGLQKRLSSENQG